MKTILLFLLLVTGCTSQYQLKDPTIASKIWSDLHPTLTVTSLRTQFSLQMETKERNARLLGQAWGYGSSVIRLDLNSSAGSTVAMIRETPSIWTVYLPSENKAYYHADARVGLNLFDIPVPCTTRQISRLLLGDFSAILPEAFEKVRGASSDKIRFSFSDGDVDYMETTESMETIFIKGRSEWTLLCEKPSVHAESGRRLFEKYTFTSGEGIAVMRIKALDTDKIWQQADLELKLPQDVQWMRLDPGAQHSLN